MVGAMQPLGPPPNSGVIYVLTHDSNRLGEAAPPTKPVETARLAALRSQPAGDPPRGDGNETMVLTEVAISNRKRPTVLAPQPPGHGLTGEQLSAQVGQRGLRPRKTSDGNTGADP